MHAHQLMMKNILRSVRENQRILNLSVAAASGAGIRLELTGQIKKLDMMERELQQIAERRGWDMLESGYRFPGRTIRQLRAGKTADPDIAQLLIHAYINTMIQSQKMLRQLPYPDRPMESAVETIRDCLFGCIFRLLSQL